MQKTEVYCANCESHIETISEGMEDLTIHSGERRIILTDGSGYLERDGCVKCPVKLV